MGMEEATLEIKVGKAEDPTESGGPGWKHPRRGKECEKTKKLEGFIFEGGIP